MKSLQIGRIVLFTLLFTVLSLSFLFLAASISAEGGEDHPSNAVYVSSSSGGRVGATVFRDEDVLVGDGPGWAIYFDGSDVGLSDADVDAVTLLDDGSLLMSLDAPFSVDGINADDSDILRFEPTSLGETTAGTFSMFVDGSDIGLNTNGEDIDSLTVLNEGPVIKLLVGFAGNAQLAGQIARDEDLVTLALSQTGDTTVGTWSVGFDGSAVGLGDGENEDVWGASVYLGELYLTTRGDYNVDGISGGKENIFLCRRPTVAPTTCDFFPFANGIALGLGGERLDAVMVVTAK